MHLVDISVWYSTLNEGVIVLLSGVALWLGYEFTAWLSAHATFLDAETQKSLADGLNRALQNGVNIAMSQLKAWEDVHKNVQVQGQVAAWAAQYAVDHSPDAVAKFGLDPTQLALKALAYLPTPATSVGTTGATVTTTSVQTTTLPPVEIPPGH